MSLVDLSRWQFGATIVYHFFFVPITIGLALVLAIMQTVAYKKNSEYWLDMVHFFSKIFTINFAIGVATGIIQEFQIGLNWGSYSKFVGDIFGAPLALEALIAFFMESTFLGLWVFGWGRLPRKVHLLCIWMVAIGVHVSAFFIITANSFMQHPVGARLDMEHNKVVLVNFWALITNNTSLVAFTHTVAGSWLTAATIVAGVAGFSMVRDYYKTAFSRNAAEKWRPVFRFGCWFIILAGVILAITGDLQGKLMFKQQPMKMASAESLCHREVGADFSILSIGTHNNCDSVKKIIFIPHLTSFLAGSNFHTSLPGVEDVQEKFTQEFGPNNYRPNLFVTYWTFRAMIGWAVGSAFIGLVGLWITRKKRINTARWFSTLCIICMPMPVFANSCGWIFTEMGRGPWAVAPNPTGDRQVRMLIRDAVSDHSTAMLIISLAIFVIAYTVLGFIWLYLQTRYVLKGLPSHSSEHAVPEDTSQSFQLDFAY